MFHRLLLSSTTAITGLVLCGASIAYADEPQVGPVEAPPVTRTRTEAGIVLSKETTFLLEPLTEDGYVDYVAALNEQYGRGVKPEENAAIPLWQIWQDEAAESYRVPLYKAWGLEPPEKEQPLYVTLPDAAKRPADSEELWNEQTAAMTAPWDARKLPAIAAWIKANEAALAKAHEAAARPKYYIPLIAEDDGTLLGANYIPIISGVRESARLLCARAMLRLHEKRYEAAWDDLMAVARLGRLVGRGPTNTDSIVGRTIEGVACSGFKQYIQHAPLTAADVDAYRKALATLTHRATIAETLKYYDRYAVLDLLSHMVREGGVRDAVEWFEDNNLPPRLIAAFDAADYNATLRAINQHYDHLVDLLKIESHEQRVQAAEALTQEVASEPDKLLQYIDDAPNKAQAAGEALAEWLLCELLTPLKGLMDIDARANQHEILIDTGFALAAYRAEQGRFPDTLADLVPKYLPEVPRDVFSGEDLIYRPIAKGYLLYSVGPNLEDDGGEERLPQGDDLALKIQR